MNGRTVFDNKRLLEYPTVREAYLYEESNGEIVWRNAKLSKSLGPHVEIVNLVIPNVNDDYESLRWLVQKHLGMCVMIHLFILLVIIPPINSLPPLPIF